MLSYFVLLHIYKILISKFACCAILSHEKFDERPHFTPELLRFAIIMNGQETNIL